MRAGTWSRGVLVAALLSGCAAKVKHVNVGPPKGPQQVSPDLVTRIGELASLAEAGGVVYAAGKNGVGAVASDGKILWTVELPYAHERYLDVKGDLLAYAAFSVKGVATGNSAKGIFLGAFGDAPEYGGCHFGLLTAAGAVRWSQECGDRAASPPAIGEKAIAISFGESLELFAIGDGAVISKPMLADAVGGLMQGFVNRASYNRPAYLKGHFTGAHFDRVVRVTEDGKVTDASRNYSVIPTRAFDNVTVGPLVVQDKIVVLGNGRMKENGQLFKSRVFALEGNNSKAWYDNLDDEFSAVCSMTAVGETIFLTTNFHAYAYSADGKQLWHQVNGGGLHPGDAKRYRGVKYLNARGQSFASRKSQGRLLQSDGRKVYLTSGYHNGDAITVLDAKTGQYVESIDMKEIVVDLALVGPKLAVATQSGLQLLSLE